MINKKDKKEVFVLGYGMIAISFIPFSFIYHHESVFWGFIGATGLFFFIAGLFVVMIAHDKKPTRREQLLEVIEIVKEHVISIKHPHDEVFNEGCLYCQTIKKLNRLKEIIEE